MSKIKRSAILAAALLLLTAGGCHGSSVNKAFIVPDTFDETVSHEITFWAKNDTNIAQTKIYKKAIEDFQKLYPSITVNLRLYTDYGRIYNDVITNIPTDTTPNVCITYPDHIATYITGEDTVVALDELFRDKKYGLGGSELKFDSPTFDEIIPQYINECSLSGNYYAIPYMRSTEACYINKTFVEKLGYTLPDELTWDFVWEVSEAAAKKNADGIYELNGQKVMIPFIYKSTDNMMIQMLRQRDAGYSDSSGRIMIFNETTREILEKVADSTKKGAFSTFKISSYPSNFLNAGQCVFAVDSTAGASWMGSHAPNLDISPDKVIEFETVVMPIPQYDNSSKKMISQGPSVCVFNKSDPQEVLASWLFAQYLLTNDVQTAYAETEGYVPVTSKAQQSEQYLDYISRAGEDYDEHYEIKIKASKMLTENVGSTFVTPVFNGSASLRDAAGEMIESVAKSVRRGEKIDDAYYERLFSNVSSLYRLEQLEMSSEGKAELGELPDTAVILLISLGTAWVLIIAYVIVNAVKRKRNSKKA